MKTPAFWDSKNTISNVLLPLAQFYDTIAAFRRIFITPQAMPVPVICIGGLTAGGAGKTPVALHVGKWLKEKDVRAFFLSRGYGGKLAGPLLVDPARHTAREVGDEPLLLAQVLPTVIAKDRAAGARFAVMQGAKAIVMDDGLQNPYVKKTLSLAVIDGQSVFGNGRVIPAGPLREPVEIGIGRAHGIVVINRSTALPPLPPERPLLAAKMELKDAPLLKGKKIIAFCGIARPEKFFGMLQLAGAQVVAAAPFPDHHPYSDADIKMLVTHAKKFQAPLVTTAKDAVRLPPEFRKQVAVIEAILTFDDPPLLDAMLNYALGQNENA